MSYLDCSSDTLCAREGIWKGDVLVAGPWGVGDDGRIGKSTQKDSMRKRWYFTQKENLFFQSQMDESKLMVEIQELRTSTSIRHRPVQGQSHLDFLGESQGSLPPPQHSLPDAGEGDKWLLVYVRKTSYNRHHVETQSQTLLAERRIIPCSTETHWRLQNYSYEFGCYAKNAASMIIGNIDGSRRFCPILGQVSLYLL